MNRQQINRAMERGQRQAEALLRARAAHRAVMAAAAPPFGGYLIAEGDSWFNYPLFDEIVERLEDDHNYRIESAARWGDTADNMLYNEGGDGKKLVKLFEKLRSDGRTPRAILLSCGGNDIAGDRLTLLLRHAKSPNPGLDMPVVDALFARLEETITGLVAMLKKLGDEFFQRDVPVVVHGYGHAVPDGRGFLHTSLFSGPWLAPSFEEKGYDSVAARIPIIATLIDGFNEVQRQIAANIPNVAYVDARPVLSNELANDAYKASWDNELHPTRNGFGAVADLFDAALQAFPIP